MDTVSSSSWHEPKLFGRLLEFGLWLWLMRIAPISNYFLSPCDECMEMKGMCVGCVCCVGNMMFANGLLFVEQVNTTCALGNGNQSQSLWYGGWVRDVDVTYDGWLWIAFHLSMVIFPSFHRGALVCFHGPSQLRHVMSITQTQCEGRWWALRVFAVLVVAVPFGYAVELFVPIWSISTCKLVHHLGGGSIISSSYLSF